MTKKRSICSISCLLAAASLLGCEPPEDPIPTPQTQITCGTKVCASNEVCILSLSACTLPELCNPTCGFNQKCEAYPQLNNPKYVQCVIDNPGIVDACGNACIAPLKCDANTGRCFDACNNSCVAPQACDPSTGQCTPVTDACGNACYAPLKCDANTRTCVDACNNSCVAPQTCDLSTGQCTSITDACNNKCIAPLKCNENTQQCVACLTNSDCTAQSGGVCQSDGTCKYVVTPPDPQASCDSSHPCSNGFCANGECKAIADNCRNCDDPERDVCTVDGCKFKACEYKTWDDSYQYCAMSGAINAYTGMCATDHDCTGEMTCNTATHLCVGNCDDIAGNIIPNWSFESWSGNAAVDNWEFQADYQGYATMSKSNEAKLCSAAVQMLNPTNNNARLESDPIGISEPPYTGGNLKYNCTVWAKGTGTLNLGYRGLDASGEKVSADTKEAKKAYDVASDSFKQYSVEVSLSTASKAFQFLIGVHDADLVVDGVSCTIPTNSRCYNKTCENDWEICSVNDSEAKINPDGSRCVPRSGYCSVYKSTGSDGSEKVTDTCTRTNSMTACDTTTHTCVGVDGKCASHKDCKDNAKPFCDTSTHECKAGDPCQNVTCTEWTQCTTASRGACELKPGRCHNLFDCDKNTPACHAATHTCVAENFTYAVQKRSECPLDWYFEYLNYDENEKDHISKNPVCPVNIVPNGSFEEWEDEEYCITVDGKPYATPTLWFGNYYGPEDGNFMGVAEHKFTNELPINAAAPYTKAAHSGTTALQIIYPYKYTTKEPKRLTSFGFKVPAGTYDCAFYVRGKGEVRVHWYGSAGESPNDMLPNNGAFIQYDTTEWQREKFEIKSGQSGMRLIFYVGDTDAGKDHIQIDDVICSARPTVY
ncbi:MAG: hypothetical protein IKY83_03355 [Proteobacteria bacterium]|nr:hypothetical protein [Pseudomonadota bacterium]